MLSRGVEPLHLTVYGPKPYASAIPPREHEYIYFITKKSPLIAEGTCRNSNAVASQACTASERDDTIAYDYGFVKYLCLLPSFSSKNKERWTKTNL